MYKQIKVVRTIFTITHIVTDGNILYTSTTKNNEANTV
jgi:hypothetical protein